MRRSQAERAMFGAVVAAALLAGPVAQAGARFLAYDGWDAVQQGRGGEKKVVAGVDFWMSGSPPRRFKILGTIEGGARRSGVIGMIATSELEGDIAERAHKAGGDGVILTDARTSLYLVVQYLADSPDPAPAYEPPPKAVITVRY